MEGSDFSNFCNCCTIRPHQRETRLIVLLEYHFQAVRRHFVDAQFHGFDQTLVGKGNHIVLIAPAAAGALSRRQPEAVFSCPLPCGISVLKDQANEMKVGMLNIVLRNFGASDNDRIAIPQRPKGGAVTHLRLDEDREGRPPAFLLQFPADKHWQL